MIVISETTHPKHHVAHYVIHHNVMYELTSRVKCSDFSENEQKLLVVCESNIIVIDVVKKSQIVVNERSYDYGSWFDSDTVVLGKNNKLIKFKLSDNSESVFYEFGGNITYLESINQNITVGTNIGEIVLFRADDIYTVLCGEPVVTIDSSHNGFAVATLSGSKNSIVYFEKCGDSYKKIYRWKSSTLGYVVTNLLIMDKLYSCHQNGIIMCHNIKTKHNHLILNSEPFCKMVSYQGMMCIIHNTSVTLFYPKHNQLSQFRTQNFDHKILSIHSNQIISMI